MYGDGEQVVMRRAAGAQCICQVSWRVTRAILCMLQLYICPASREGRAVLEWRSGFWPGREVSDFSELGLHIQTWGEGKA